MEVKAKNKTKIKFKRLKALLKTKNKVKILVKTHKDKYSPMKSKVKPLLPNSVLKPLTNSDSPSKRSKGVRLSSAKQDMYHKTKTKTLKILLKIYLWKVEKLKVLLKVKNIKIKNIKMMSYEHIWATLRIEPIEVKIELDLHLDQREGNIMYKLIKINKTKLKLKLKTLFIEPKVTHIKRDKIKNIVGIMS